MRNILTTTAFCVLLMLFSGCTKYWYRPDTTFDQCKRDRNACLDALVQRSDMSYITDYEIKFMETCMREKGYEMVEKDQLPMDVKRQEPETSLHWRMNGLAGTLNSTSP